MTGGEWRIGIVFEAQLDRLSDRFSRDLGYDPEAKVDPGCNTTRRDDISVPDHTAFFMRCADERQQLGKGPVSRRAPTLEEPGDAENEGSSAHGGHEFSRTRLPSDEFDRLAVGHRLDHAGTAARHTDQIEARASMECMGPGCVKSRPML